MVKYAVWSADFSSQTFFGLKLETHDLSEAKSMAYQEACSFHGDDLPRFSDWCGENNNEMHVRKPYSGGGALIWRYESDESAISEIDSA